jgi:hypothetical protein
MQISTSVGVFQAIAFSSHDDLGDAGGVSHTQPDMRSRQRNAGWSLPQLLERWKCSAFGIPILRTNGECPLADRWSGNKSAS